MKNFKFTINGNVYEVAVEAAENGKSNVTVNGKSYVVETEAQAAQPTVRRAAAAGATKTVSGVMKSPLPGKVLKVLVSAGQSVKRGDTLMVIESMKMENNIAAQAVHRGLFYIQAGKQPHPLCRSLQSRYAYNLRAASLWASRRG